MNTDQVEVFGGVIEQLQASGYTDLYTEHDPNIVRVYGTKNKKKDLVAIIGKNGNTEFNFSQVL